MRVSLGYSTPILFHRQIYANEMTIPEIVRENPTRLVTIRLQPGIRVMLSTAVFCPGEASGLVTGRYQKGSFFSTIYQTWVRHGA